MDIIIDFFSNLTDREWIMANGGFWIVIAIIFAETGLFIGFFLPGDHLLFLTGLLLNGYTDPYESPFANWFYWSTLITIAAILGNYVGYWFGYKSGDYLFRRKDTWFLKKKHLYQAKAFYEKKGGFAIVVARFLPIIRTFAPIIAGVVKMRFIQFTIYNILGAIIWVYGLTIAGFLLGKNQWVNDHLEYIIIGIILITTGPILYKFIFGKSVAEAAHLEPDEVKIETVDDDEVK